MAIEYHPPRRAGAECPQCKAWVPHYCVLPEHMGMIVRYHACTCGFKFKSIERILPQL